MPFLRAKHEHKSTCMPPQLLHFIMIIFNQKAMLLFLPHIPFVSLCPSFFSSLTVLLYSHLPATLLVEQKAIRAPQRDKKKKKGKIKNQLTIDMPPAPSTRWCPTPEQLMILEELYRSGVRTPDAPQIQQITAHLSCYGRIEGKNVFYWFQNHKARERQKLRRRLSMHHHLLCTGYPLPLLPHRPLHLYQDHATATHSPLLLHHHQHHHHHHHHQQHQHQHQHHHHMSPSHFFPQESTNQGLNLLRQLDTKGEETSAVPNDEVNGHEWTLTTGGQPTNLIPPISTRKLPLKTLDLFPTWSSSSSSSTALKDEHKANTSKYSAS